MPVMPVIIDELTRSKQCFDKIILNLSAVAKERHELWSDMERTLAQSQLYEKLQSEQPQTDRHQQPG